MKDAIRSSFRPLRSNLETLILFSLWITLAKVSIALVRNLFVPGWVTVIHLFLVVLVFAQILAFMGKRKFAWILSAIQTASIYFFSVGTFGYLFSYLLDPLTLDQPSYVYLVPACVLGSEVWKTLYFHKHCRN